MSIFSKIYEIGKTIHDTIKEINILDEIYKQDERIYKGSLLNQIDEMENSANGAYSEQKNTRHCLPNTTSRKPTFC